MITIKENENTNEQIRSIIFSLKKKQRKPNIFWKQGLENRKNW